jgi:hypothetical protein
MGKFWSEIEGGVNGVFGGIRMASKGVALFGYPKTICTRHGMTKVIRGSVAENVEN